jgi:hypothetical protein
MNRAQLLVSVLSPSVGKKKIIDSAPPFSFGAIVRLEVAIPDGQIITCVDPVYRHLVEAIEKNPEIIYSPYAKIA